MRDHLLRGISMSETETSTTQGISRRSLAAGVAWTAPAIWMASAAPAMAASLDLWGSWRTAQFSCGNGKWYMGFTVNNPRPVAVKITTITIQRTTSSFGTWNWTGVNQNVAANSSVVLNDKAISWLGSSALDFARWGAEPDSNGVAEANYCKTGTCTASNDTCLCGDGSVPTGTGPTNYTCPGGCRLVGPCAILAMQGPYTVTISGTQVSGAAFTWSTTLVNSLPLACGDKNNNNCEGLATNVP